MKSVIKEILIRKEENKIPTEREAERKRETPQKGKEQTTSKVRKEKQRSRGCYLQRRETGLHISTSRSEEKA